MNDGSPPAVFDVHHLCGARSRESVKTKQNKKFMKIKNCVNVVESWRKCLENVEVGGDLLGATGLRKFKTRSKVTRKQKLAPKF